MKAELEARLKASHPKILRLLRNHRTTQTIRHRIQTGPGWYALIDQLCSDLQAAVDAGVAPQIEVVDIKEKLGGLRFSARVVAGAGRASEADVLGSLIEAAERRSMETCEVCGQPGRRRTDDWLTTLCDEHDADRSWAHP